KLTPMFRDAKVAPEHGLCSGGSQAHDYFRFDHQNLGIQPRLAGFDLAGCRLLVEPAFAPRLPSEVFDGVRDVNIVARNACLIQRVVEKSPGGANEWVALLVLFITRYFAQQNHVSSAGSLAENGLCGVPVQIATLAACSRLAKGA